ncbi:putative Zn-dependent peptidase [Desulfitispora alkaliphila]|uniref:M16 family metallopeptidase n=1 Tax=Desulfitispora alkaliphila TaxID=622674 RepID=UPI003D1B207D
MYKKEKLNNGIRIVTEEIPHVKSVVLGIWVKVGSRDETEEEHGLSHLLEHLMFKGTEKRTARQIGEELDAVGGQLNAFTAKEYTCYYCRVLDEHLDMGIDVLTDMFFNSTFKEKDIEREKKVVLEEIKMYEDAPDELIHDYFSQFVWANSTLGKPILGTMESVAGLNREKVLSYYNKHYRAPNIVVAVAGKVKHDDIVAKLKPIFEKVEIGSSKKDDQVPTPNGGMNCNERKTEQLQICIGGPGLPQLDDNIYTLHLINNILGGGMSSRLFQEIREERGLAYSVYSYHSAFRDCGLFTVYAGTNPDNFDEVTTVVLEQFSKLKDELITDNELKKNKEQIKGNIYLGLENVSSRMSRLGKSELCYNRLISPSEVIEKVNAVSVDEIKELANEIFDTQKIAVSTVGADCGIQDIQKFLKK